jgi:hypothetical protein
VRYLVQTRLGQRLRFWEVEANQSEWGSTSSRFNSQRLQRKYILRNLIGNPLLIQGHCSDSTIHSLNLEGSRTNIRPWASYKHFSDDFGYCKSQSSPDKDKDIVFLAPDLDSTSIYGGAGEFHLRSSATALS